MNGARKRMNISHYESEYVNYSARGSEGGRFSTGFTCVSSDFERSVRWFADRVHEQEEGLSER